MWLKSCLTDKMEIQAFHHKIYSSTFAAIPPSGTKLNFLLLFMSGTIS